MHVDDADTPLLKSWIVKRLEDISDADTDVLADYVLALVKSDDTDEQVRANSLESLEDFLKEHTAKFVDDTLQTIRTKSYDPNAKPPAPPTGPSFNPPAGPSGTGNRRSSLPGQNGQNGGVNGAAQSRKRNYHSMGGEDSQDGRDSHYGRGGDRAIKQMRRGGGQGGIPTGPAMGNGRGRDANLGGMSRNSMGQSGMPNMPTPPPGFPPLDPNNPLAAMMAMQAMFPMAGFPPIPGAGSPGFGQSASPPHNLPPKKVGQRCRDYDNKGFCALGTTCPYEHGPNSIIVGGTEEYDPAKGLDQSSNGHSNEFSRSTERGRGRGRGRGDRGHGGKQRAAFSQVGPNHDKTNTKIVVEQIPEEKFDEQIVREFFSEFGNITDVKMQAYKHLAIVTFEDYPAARKAWESPAAVFENRFVKVYWYKPDSVPTPPTNGRSEFRAPEPKPDEEMIDPVEFERKQAEAQKAHEEKRQKMEAAKAEREALEQKVKAQAEERKKLLEKLAAKQGGKTDDTAATTDSASASGAATSQTEALRAKLAELEAEAEAIGLNPHEQYNPNYRGRGRGGYRARGGFPPRGRGYDLSRGSYRGRGAFAGASRGGVMRLDNRPKKVVVTAATLSTPENEEAFRQHLFNNYEFDNVEPLSDKKDSFVVGFKERYIAEMFMNAPSEIPTIGKVEKTWSNAPPTVATPSSASASNANKELGVGRDVNMGSDASGAAAPSDDAPRAEMDYDVADDEDQWMGA